MANIKVFGATCFSTTQDHILKGGFGDVISTRANHAPRRPFSARLMRDARWGRRQGILTVDSLSKLEMRSETIDMQLFSVPS